MGKCKNCKVEVLDVTERCPLCQSVLEQTDSLENMYPNARIKMRRLMLMCRIYLFCAIVTGIVLFCIDLHTESAFWWSSIANSALLLVYLVLRYAIIGKGGYRSKIVLVAVLVVLYTVTVDIVIGYQGWSVDYVLPAGIMLVDGLIIFCMINNHRNWQSYIMWQLFMILLSFIPAVLFWAKLERNPYMAFLPLVVSSLLFLGTMIIGDRRARVELKRRFHIN